MGMLWVAGRHTNLWGEGLALVGSTEHERLPARNLACDNPALPASAADTQNPWTLELDARLAPFTDPHFDGAWVTAPEGWTHVGAGALTRDAAITSTGSGAACRFNNAAGPSLITIEGDVACGAVVDLSAQFRGGYPALAGHLLCLDTGLYWSGETGEWVAWEAPALVYPAEPPGHIYTRVGTTATMPNLVDGDVVRVRLVLGLGDGVAGDAWVDDLRVLAQASIWSLHHTRHCHGATFTLEASDTATGSEWTQVASLPGATARYEAYARFAQRSARRWRLRTGWSRPLDHILPVPWGFPGPPAIGESVLGLAFEARGTWSRRTDTFEWPQVRAGVLDRHRFATAGGAQRRVTLEREGASLEVITRTLNRLLRPTGGGVRSALVVFDESKPTGVVYGVLEREWSYTEDPRQPNYPHRLTIAGYAPAIWTD